MIVFLFFATLVFAQQVPVEINGDKISYKPNGRVAVVEGNVSIVSGSTSLSADRIEFNQDTSEAHAFGNVVLISPEGRIDSEEIKYNFSQQSGKFEETRIEAYPFYIDGEEFQRMDDGRVVVSDGRFTTSDYDDPEYHVAAEKITYIPNEKIIAEDIRLKLYDKTLLYWPKLTHSLTDLTGPCFDIKPGYDSEWGAFLLTEMCYELNESLKANFHLDYRELLDFAFGVDVSYDTQNFGKGISRNYYMNERDRQGEHWFENDDPMTEEQQRYWLEWRHRWNMDDADLLVQVSERSDDVILKRYFEDEFERDPSPPTFLYYKRNFPVGELSVLTTPRVNDFEAGIDKLPEVEYTVTGLPINETGLYWKNKTQAGYFVDRESNVGDEKRNNTRVDIDHEVSYPMRIGTVNVTPYVGSRHTHYHHLKTDENRFRSFFKAGVDTSMRFSKVLDFYDIFGIDFDALRHVVIPEVSYNYVSDSTLDTTEIEVFDDIDVLNFHESVRLSMINKIQGKRNGKKWDVLRLSLDADYVFDDPLIDDGFQTFEADLGLAPVDWMAFSSELTYDIENDDLLEFNNYFSIAPPENNWKLSLGHRYSSTADDQITSHWEYKLNHKWSFETYHRFDFENNELEEQEYTITRDLHVWEMDLNFNDTQGDGQEFWIVFRLKGLDRSAWEDRAQRDYTSR